MAYWGSGVQLLVVATETGAPISDLHKSNSLSGPVYSDFGVALNALIITSCLAVNCSTEYLAFTFH